MSFYTRPDGGARSISMRELASLPFDSLVSTVAPAESAAAAAAAAAAALTHARPVRAPSSPTPPHVRRTSSSGLGAGTLHRPLPAAGAAGAAPSAQHGHDNDHDHHDHLSHHHHHQVAYDTQPQHQTAGGGRMSRQPSSSLGGEGGEGGRSGRSWAPAPDWRFGGTRSFGGSGMASGRGGSILDGLHLHPHLPPLHENDTVTSGQRGPGLGLGLGLGRSASSPARARGRAAAAPPAAAATVAAPAAAASAAAGQGLLGQHLRRGGSLMDALVEAAEPPLQQLVAEEVQVEVQAPAAPRPRLAMGPGPDLVVGGLLGPGLVLRRAVSAARPRPRSEVAMDAGDWEGVGRGSATRHAAPPRPRPRVVELDADGWEVPPPELLHQAPGAADGARHQMGSGGRQSPPPPPPPPQQQHRRIASTGRHPRLSRGGGGAAAADDDDDGGWPFDEGFGPGVGRGLFPLMPMMPLGPLGDMLGGGLGGLGLGLGLRAVLLPPGIAAVGGGGSAVGGGVRLGSADGSVGPGGSGRPPSAAGGGGGGNTGGGHGYGYEELVALDQGRVKRVVRPEVVRALPQRTARRSDARQQCGVCLERYREGGSAITTLPCGHAFCSGCVEPWLGGQAATCPTCRWAFPPEQTHLLMEPQ